MTSSSVVGAERPPTNTFLVRVTIYTKICRERERGKNFVNHFFRKREEERKRKKVAVIQNKKNASETPRAQKTRVIDHPSMSRTDVQKGLEQNDFQAALVGMVTWTWSLWTRSLGRGHFGHGHLDVVTLDTVTLDMDILDMVTVDTDVEQLNLAVTMAVPLLNGTFGSARARGTKTGRRKEKEKE